MFWARQLCALGNVSLFYEREWQFISDMDEWKIFVNSGRGGRLSHWIGRVTHVIRQARGNILISHMTYHLDSIKATVGK